MIDIQTVACFNTCSPILHLFLPSNAKYITQGNVFTGLCHYVHSGERGVWQTPPGTHTPGQTPPHPWADHGLSVLVDVYGLLTFRIQNAECLLTTIMHCN